MLKFPAPPALRSSSALLLLASATLFAGCAQKLEVYRNQGVKLYQEKQYDESLSALKNALAHDQFDAVSNTYAGLIYYRAGDLEQATYHFRVALQSDPSSEQAKDGLTASLIKLGKPDLALDALERSAKLAENVNDPRWRKTLPKHQYDKQVQEGLYTGKLDDRIRIGRAYEQLGDYDNAVLYYKKALALTPKSAAAMMALADLYTKLGNKAETREYLIQAYRVDPGYPGLTDALTRNGVAISNILETPAPQQPIVPAPQPHESQ